MEFEFRGTAAPNSMGVFEITGVIISSEDHFEEEIRNSARNEQFDGAF